MFGFLLDVVAGTVFEKRVRQCFGLWVGSIRGSEIRRAIVLGPAIRLPTDFIQDNQNRAIYSYRKGVPGARAGYQGQ